MQVKLTFAAISEAAKGNFDAEKAPGAGGVLPYMGYIGTCRGVGYGFWRFSILK